MIKKVKALELKDYLINIFILHDPLFSLFLTH